jgi:imidazole glycerol-phosphate synthase subunit HisF
VRLIMKKCRVIARLDVKGPNVIKGIQLECLRIVGKPGELAEKYYLQNADELIYIDTVASLYGRDNLLEIVHKASDKIFIPFTVGGGIRSLEDIKEFLKAGADKVAINTAATKNPSLIKEASRKFGSQCIVISIEAKKKSEGKWEVYIENGRQMTGLDVMEWAKKVEKLGAGEILLTSIDKEGVKNGFELELVKAVTEAVSIPVIASGGAGKIEDVHSCMQYTDSVALASILHYDLATVKEIKNHLEDNGVPTRK